ncbi:MAG: phosphohydrolase [candidate division WWE3 bacterium]|nr:phosphohydrolase [candidate division WWE3 bacterium]
MQSQNLRRHCYAVEAVMRVLAEYFKEDEGKWGIVGLLHDGDYEKTKETPEKHTLLMVEWLKETGEGDPEILSAILSHNYGHPSVIARSADLPAEASAQVGGGPSNFAHTGQNAPQNKLEWSLYCCDELTGLIVAVALVRPDRKLSSVTVDSILKKWDEKSFAAGVKREQVAECEAKLGIPLREFIQLALSAMQKISSELGL